MILSVDPGGTTGVAVAASSVHFYEIPGGHTGMVDWFTMFLVSYGYPDIIVCESFIPRPGAKSMQYDALYLIGYLSGWAHLHGVPFKLQSPAQAKSFATNDKLKAAGFYPVGKGHAQDAARHLLVHVVGADPQGPVAQRVAEVLR